jgi:hypothetical protein
VQQKPLNLGLPKESAAIIRKYQEYAMKSLSALLFVFFALPAWAQNNLNVEFRWLISHHCSGTSPAIKLKNIPPGATQLKVQMVDLDNHSHDHGGGLLMKAEGFPAEFVIEPGALDKYKGPCPENFTTLGHEYQFNVSTLNADNKVLSSGSAKATFSAKFVILQGVIGNQ